MAMDANGMPMQLPRAEAAIKTRPKRGRPPKKTPNKKARLQNTCSEFSEDFHIEGMDRIREDVGVCVQTQTDLTADVLNSYKIEINRLLEENRQLKERLGQIEAACYCNNRFQRGVGESSVFPERLWMKEEPTDPSDDSYCQQPLETHITDQECMRETSLASFFEQEQTSLGDFKVEIDIAEAEEEFEGVFEEEDKDGTLKRQEKKSTSAPTPNHHAEPPVPLFLSASCPYPQQNRKGKSRASYYRRRLKADPERYAKYREENRIRCRQYREAVKADETKRQRNREMTRKRMAARRARKRQALATTSKKVKTGNNKEEDKPRIMEKKERQYREAGKADEAKRQRNRELSRKRMVAWRARKRQALATGNNIQEDKPRKMEKKERHRNDKEEADRRREKWREDKRKRHSRFTPQERIAMNRHRREKYLEKKLAKIVEAQAKRAEAQAKRAERQAKRSEALAKKLATVTQMTTTQNDSSVC